MPPLAQRKLSVPPRPLGSGQPNESFAESSRSLRLDDAPFVLRNQHATVLAQRFLATNQFAIDSAASSPLR
jgi:hypothetical protein